MAGKDNETSTAGSSEDATVRMATESARAWDHFAINDIRNSQFQLDSTSVPLARDEFYMRL